MKIHFFTLGFVVALIVPTVSFAQVDSNGPLTRDEVRSQLVQAEQQGTLRQSRAHYPDYSAQPSARNVVSADSTSYGSAMNGASQSGSRHMDLPQRTGGSLYRGH